MDNGNVWTVTRQREDREWIDGQYLPGMVIHFQTGSGHEGSVFVADTDYTEARIRDRIAARAAVLESVGRLTGS